MSTEGTIDETIENFKKLCDKAKEYSLKIGLEFIGHIPKVDNIKIASEIIKRAKCKNSGIVLDLFHFYRGNSSIEDLKVIKPDDILIVHLDDAMDFPRKELIGYKHRLYPGKGIIPVKEILSTLKEMQYQGWFSIELFNQEYWTSDPKEIAAKAREMTLSLMGKV